MGGQLPSIWLDLRANIAHRGHILDEEVFNRICSLFIDQYANETPAALTREYAQNEYLLVVGADGQPCGRGEGLLGSYHQVFNAYSGFGNWFQAGVLRDKSGSCPGEPVLLAARWLCHLVGLRHQTVELFIDPPAVEGHTLVQVRGVNKVLAPGVFDIPCAGHIDGEDGVEESLCKELGEELNLDTSDLENLTLVAHYATEVQEYASEGLVNVEYCFLFRARLKASSVSRIRFTDGEVAGLALFDVNQLRELARRFPERVASGLSDSLPYYQDCTSGSSIPTSSGSSP